MQHVDMGNIYNTIDDFHFMPAVFEWHPSVQQSYYQQRVLTLQVLCLYYPHINVLQLEW